MEKNELKGLEDYLQLLSESMLRLSTLEQIISAPRSHKAYFKEEVKIQSELLHDMRKMIDIIRKNVEKVAE